MQSEGGANILESSSHVRVMKEKRRRDEGKEEEVIFIAMKNLLRFPSPGFHARREGSFLNRATFCLSFEFDERGNDYEGRNCLSFEDEKERTCFSLQE